RTVMYYEGARVHAQRYKEYGDRLDAAAEGVRQGSQIPDRVYDDAKRQIAESQARVAELYKTTPVLPGAGGAGPAPAGAQTPGGRADDGAVDRAGHAGDLDPDAGRRRAAARPATHRRSRPGRPRDPGRDPRAQNRQPFGREI